MQMDNVTQIAGLAAPDVRELRSRIAGDLYVPGDDAWDEARQPWNRAADQRPTAVVVVEGATDVAEVIEFARENDLRVAPQGTGHAASAFSDLQDTILLKTHRMREVTIDAERRIARAEAGSIWIDVVEAAAEHGLAALAGSSPDVGVVGYTLGGGLSWLARKHGIGAKQVTAGEVVTPDGGFVRATRENEPDLFWAVRGGGGNFGVVTAIEFNLFPISEVYAGILWFPVERATEVLKAWREWTDTVPDELTSVGRILQLPPIPEIPEPVRGKSFVIVEAIFLGDDSEGAKLVEPLRALGPVMDTVATIPVTGLSRLHMDPEGPTAGVADGGMVDDVEDELIELLVANVVGKPLVSVEIRHIGGAVGRPRPEHGAVASFDAPYIVFSVGMTPNDELFRAVHGSIKGIEASLEPYWSAHTYLNFAEGKRDPRGLFTETAYHRLRRVKAKYDPVNVIRSNHELEPDERYC